MGARPMTCAVADLLTFAAGAVFGFLFVVGCIAAGYVWMARGL